ncbi:MAG TPA: hypothetical protein VLK23_15250 [Thermodesulfobacteriota bacterium]|nr:hypothetical protein [Thermodesulfobacteriota bacterium]
MKGIKIRENAGLILLLIGSGSTRCSDEFVCKRGNLSRIPVNAGYPVNPALGLDTDLLPSLGTGIEGLLIIKGNGQVGSPSSRNQPSLTRDSRTDPMTLTHVD